MENCICTEHIHAILFEKVVFKYNKEIQDPQQASVCLRIRYSACFTFFLRVFPHPLKLLQHHVAVLIRATYFYFQREKRRLNDLSIRLCFVVAQLLSASSALGILEQWPALGIWQALPVVYTSVLLTQCWWGMDPTQHWPHPTIWAGKELGSLFMTFFPPLRN